MVVIEKENVEVEARSKVVRKDEEAANVKAAEAQALKDEVCVKCVCLHVSIIDITAVIKFSP